MKTTLHLEEVLKEVEDLDSKATKGPWVFETDDFGDCIEAGESKTKVLCPKIAKYSINDCGILSQQDLVGRYDDIKMLTRARTLLPKLAQVVELLYGKLSKHYHNKSPWLCAANFSVLDGEIDEILNKDEK